MNQHIAANQVLNSRLINTANIHFFYLLCKFFLFFQLFPSSPLWLRKLPHSFCWHNVVIRLRVVSGNSSCRFCGILPSLVLPQFFLHGGRTEVKRAWEECPDCGRWWVDGSSEGLGTDILAVVVFWYFICTGVWRRKIDY